MFLVFCFFVLAFACIRIRAPGGAAVLTALVQGPAAHGVTRHTGRVAPLFFTCLSLPFSCVRLPRSWRSGRRGLIQSKRREPSSPHPCSGRNAVGSGSCRRGGSPHSPAVLRTSAGWHSGRVRAHLSRPRCPLPPPRALKSAHVPDHPHAVPPTSRRGEGADGGGCGAAHMNPAPRSVPALLAGVGGENLCVPHAPPPPCCGTRRTHRCAVSALGA